MQNLQSPEKDSVTYRRIPARSYAFLCNKKVNRGSVLPADCFKAENGRFQLSSSGKVHFHWRALIFTKRRHKYARRSFCRCDF